MTILGHDPLGQNVWIYPEERLTGTYIIGANGTGKSTLLLNMISQDIEQGFGVCLLDPHGDLTNAVINRIPAKRINDVILLNPLDVDYPFGLNLFTCSDMRNPARVEHAVEQIVQIFSKVFGMGVETPRLNQYVRHISYSLVGSGYTMCEIPLLLLDKAFRDKVVTNVPSTATRLFWKAFDGLRPTEQLDRSESTLDRVDSLLSNSIIRNIVGQTQTTISFPEVMDSGKILLVSLSAQYESLTSLLGSIIIGQLLTASLSRAATNKRRQFNLYADEYQRFATPDFATLLTEARKFGVATTIAHQVRSQLDEKNAATALQAGSLVCFRLTSEDADELAAEFLLQPEPSQTIPRNCLEYIDRHKNEIVKLFAARYIHRLEEGQKAKGDAEHYPVFDFGEGNVYIFNDQWIPEALRIIQTTIYNTMQKGKPMDIEGAKLMGILSNLLRFKYFYEVVYVGKNDLIEPTKEKHEERLQTDSDYAALTDRLLKQYNEERLRYDRFYTSFFIETLDILAKEPIFATATGDEIGFNAHSFADKKNEVANQLVHLKRGQAMVKLPKGEYLMETIPNTSSHADSSKKQQIIDITRRKYCRSRHEVEEEIRKRQERDEPPTSKRRGSV